MMAAGWGRRCAGRALAALAPLAVLLPPPAARAAEPDLASCRKAPSEVTAEAAPFSLKNEALTPAVAFLDLGCALVWRRQLCAMDMVAFDGNSLVRDHATGREVAAEKAWYVLAAGVETPYGFGIVAFEQRAAAEELVARRGAGRIATFDELKSESLTRHSGGEAARPGGAAEAVSPQER